MANYGPPGGPYPGPSREPWSDPDDEPTEQYRQPTDPWGGQGAPAGYSDRGAQGPAVPPVGPGAPVVHGGHPGSYPADRPGPADRDAVPAWDPREGAPGWHPPVAEPARASPGIDPAWSTSEPEPTRRRNGVLFVGTLAALALLVCGGAGLGAYLLRRDVPPPEARPSTGPFGEPTGAPSASAPAPPTAGAPSPSTDARFVKTGQCVTNEGSEAAPRLTITRCAPQTYEVLARIDGSTTGPEDAKTKCGKVEGYTNFYFFDSGLDDLDFVLCLRRR
ncbi:LppU/SCO3897 family protein [Plantactinospora sp. CA-290183]|uniref:LppU/SCO3897 family protein n=1 Tax=Plantactinospora sp. CA-290183 TaxID=3240006 RepID=UPI003D93124A